MAEETARHQFAMLPVICNVRVPATNVTAFVSRLVFEGVERGGGSHLKGLDTWLTSLTD